MEPYIKQCQGRMRINGVWNRCNNDSKYFCLDHGICLCGECMDTHNYLGCDSVTYLEYFNTTFYIKFVECAVLNQVMKSNQKLNQNEIIESMDRRNKFIYLDSNTIKIGQKFNNNGLDSQDPFLVVSFVGNTGSGKSCIVGSLCVESDNYPIPSYSNSNSISLDINSFLGKTNDSNLKYLLLDTESLNLSVIKDSNNQNDTGFIKEKVNEKRFKIVQKVYPMLLYTISDVIVYTYSGSASEKTQIIESLYSFSLVSSSITNKTSKPHLIILFNRQSNSNLFKDSNSATDDFFKSCSGEQKSFLIHMYESIKVIYLPNLNETNSFSTFKTQLELLKQLVSDGINDSLEYKKSNNLMVTRDHGISMVTKLIEKFNMDPNSNLDLERIGITCIKNDRSNLSKRTSFSLQYSNSSSSSIGSSGDDSNSQDSSDNYMPLSFRNITNIKQCQGKVNINGVKIDCTSKSTFFCLDHNQCLCGKCMDTHDKQFSCDSITYNEYLNSTFYIEFGEILNQFFKSNPHLNQNQVIKSIDRRNKFIYINSNSNTIKIGQKFNNNGLDAQDPFLVVSLIGNTGSGKSCTIGSLCIESDNHPIPSYTNSESTSSDINSFLGETIFNNDEKRFKYLLLDTEGFGGTPPSVNDNGTIKEINQYKSNWVEMGYPRLLYILSDILIYTHGSSSREKANILSRILNASEISSSNSNNLFKPHLIILFTKNEIGDKFKNLDYAKEDFFKNCKRVDVKNLESLFRSVSVIYTSTINQKNGLLKYIDSIRSLNKLIGDRLENSIQFKRDQNFNFNIKSNLRRVKKIINYLQYDPTGIPNLQLLNATGVKESSSIQKVFRNRSFNDGAGIIFSKKQHFNDCINNAVCLANYFEYKYLQLIKSGKYSIRKCFEIAFGSLKLVLLKNYKKFQRENNLNIDSMVEDYSFILNFVSRMIHEKSPCEELVNGKFECINHKDSHPHHQSLETETKSNHFIKTVFGSPKTYQVPYTSKGNHHSSLERLGLSPCLESKIIKGELKIVSASGSILNLEQAIKNCESFCIGCIAKKPTIHYSCGHIICLSCTKESKQGECIIEGCNGEILNKKDVDFNPAIGCRILSIDGGGIKSISQCIALQIMKEELYGIEIYQLFDLIVGMNTGGFIGLCLLTTKSELDQVIELFTEFITLNSNDKQITSKRYIEILKELLKKELGDSPLKDSYSKTRLFIPSVKLGDKLDDDYILVNYYKVSNGVDSYDYNIQYNNAGCYSMLPLFLSKVSGSTSNTKCSGDNPCTYAIDEYKSLWGDSCKNIDTFISLGSGVFTSKDILNQISTFTKESKSNILMEELNETNKLLLGADINTFRVNGKFFNEDYWDSIDKLYNNINEIKSKYSTDKTLFNSINKSLSSLFYLSSLEYSNNILSGTIKCRLTSIPTQLINQLNERYQKFYLQDNNDESNSDFIITSKEITSSNISIQFIITNPPDIIDIRCSLVSKSGRINNTSISSCPFSITQDLDYLNKSYK